jgi:adenylosuccinate synthase
LHPGRRCLLGNGVVLDPFQLFDEMDKLIARGIDAEERVGVSLRAHLLLPYHKLLDQAAEVGRGGRKIGTTGRGIGPAYEDKVARQGIRTAELRSEGRARELLAAGVKRANSRLAWIGAEDRIDADEMIEQVFAIRERLLRLLVDTGHVIDDALAAGQQVLLEGAQGALLDVDHGTYPYVTSSNTTAGGAALGVGIGPTMIDAVLGVVKAYTTRVGEGPLPTELPSPLQEQVRELGAEFGATTGRPRRCGWFDAVVVRFARRVNGLTGLAVTKLDVLDTLPEIQIATGYLANDGMLDDFPGDLELLAEARPVYETLPGWQTSTQDARQWEDLPHAAQVYLRRIEELTETPIWYVSVGTRRDQILVVS